MQSSDITRKFALLTRQELAYLSGGLPELTNTQKSKINYKIKKKLEIFEKVELPLLLRAGLNPVSVSLSSENDKEEDCHSFDPASKFGLRKPNGYPGPGALLFPNNETGMFAV
jgi:hypothetical protein